MSDDQGQDEVPEPNLISDISEAQHTKFHWGVPISEARQAELRALADRQREWAKQPQATRGRSHFGAVQLTGADVFWLVAYFVALAERMWDDESAPDVSAAADEVRKQFAGGIDLASVHLEESFITGAHLEGANLLGAHLEGIFFTAAHLEGADLSAGTHLEDARFQRAYLKGADLSNAHLEGAEFFQAHLEGARLGGAHLEGSDLSYAHLEGTYLSGTHLEGADLSDAHLEGRRLQTDEEHRLQVWTGDFPDALQPANLEEAFFSTATKLKGVTLGSADYGFVHVADVQWGGVNLAVVNWTQQARGKRRNRLKAVMLGDEREACKPKDENGKPKAEPVRLAEFERAVRANRQLATVLRDQGLNEDADRFAYRAQVLQRVVLRRQHQYGRALFSGFLDLLAGHGYKPERSLIAYLIAIIGFGIAYYFIGQTVGPHLSPVGAFVFSMTSFHGRGFFPGGIALDDPITVLAAFEAFVGLVIEVSFIATFTNRFFAR